MFVSDQDIFRSVFDFPGMVLGRWKIEKQKRDQGYIFKGSKSTKGQDITSCSVSSAKSLRQDFLTAIQPSFASLQQCFDSDTASLLCVAVFVGLSAIVACFRDAQVTVAMIRVLVSIVLKVAQ